MKKFLTWLPRVLTIIAFIAILWLLLKALLLFLIYNWNVILFPYPVDYGEGPILDQVMRLAKFQNIYLNRFDIPPYIVANYPPAYHLAQLPFAFIFGPAYWYGRLISFLSVLASAILITLIINKITKNLSAAIISGLLLLTFPYILHWSPFCRVDSFALGLSLAGLFCVVQWGRHKKGWILSGIFLTAAIFTRQSYGLAAPFAAFIWLLSSKPRKYAFYLTCWVFSLSIVLFLILNISTKGGFYFNIITANVNQFNWSTVNDYKNAIWEHIPYWVICIGIYLLSAVWCRNKAWWILAPYLVGACISAVTIGKAGSNVNYLFELCAAVSLALGSLIALTHKRWWMKIILYGIIAYQLVLIYPWVQHDYYQWVINRVQKERVGIGELYNYIQDSNGPVLADEFMGLIVLDHQPLYYQPFEFKQLEMSGKWSQVSFLTEIENKEFGLILLYDPPTWDSRRERWTPEQIMAIEDNYIKIGRYANTLIYWRY